jgi:hypothetical protein
MPLVSGRTPAREVALWAFGLHALAALWVWWRWGTGVRGGLLFWMDFPLSLLYAGARSTALLAASVALGGAWWALVAAGLTVLVGRIARDR